MLNKSFLILKFENKPSLGLEQILIGRSLDYIFQIPQLAWIHLDQSQKNRTDQRTRLNLDLSTDVDRKRDPKV